MNNSLTPEEWKKQKSTVTTAQGKIQAENVHEGCIRPSKGNTDYHQRFRERFAPKRVEAVSAEHEEKAEVFSEFLRGYWEQYEPQFLAFIDETIQQDRKEQFAKEFEKRGKLAEAVRAEERAALIEKVRELTIDGPNIVPYVETHDLLTHLRGEGLCIFHKDKNCCAYDVKQRSGIQEETECAQGCPEDPTRHKPRTEHPNEVMVIEGKDLKVTFAPRTEFKKFKEGEAKLSKLPRTEETDIPTCPHGLSTPFCPDCQETEKEGASFPGRGLWVTCEKDYKTLCAHWHFEKCDCECHSRPEKTNTPSESTPQSREQGGKEQYPFYPLKVPYCKCDDPKCPLREPETNQ